MGGDTIDVISKGSNTVNRKSRRGDHRHIKILNCNVTAEDESNFESPQNQPHPDPDSKQQKLYRIM